MPVPVIVRCAVSLICILLAGACLIAAAANHRFALAASALVLGTVGLGALAFTCLTVLHCADARQRLRARR
jgi:DMSO/TMAO reductase YedYZ heme-binding membrane subunit